MIAAAIKQARTMSNTFSLLFFLLSLLITPSVPSTVDRGEHHQYYFEVNLQSQTPAAICSSHGELSGNSLKVAHRYGPCSAEGGGSLTEAIHSELLDRDGLRVEHIQQSLLLNSSHHEELQLPGSQVSIPARRGLALNTGNYVITVGLGTPSRSQTVAFDTGSTVSWVQCKPCFSCHSQKEPTFDPAASATYRNISCGSAACSSLSPLSCISGPCIYAVLYGDRSSTTGVLGQDRLSLTASAVLPAFVFGCGQENQGLFGKEAGLFGLSRGAFSLASQTSSRYGGVFSYCLPSLSSSTGDLTFGPVSGNVLYTPMLTDRRVPALYFLQLTAISVGGRVLPISPTLFSNVGTLIDSGTVITRLPSTAYAALRAAFRSAMARYKLGKPLSILDTCYDFTGVRTVTVPVVALHFGGGVMLNLGYREAMYVVSTSQVCLAFAGNTGDTGVAILGNQQQKTLRVVYDSGAKRIGFGPGGC